MAPRGGLRVLFSAAEIASRIEGLAADIARTIPADFVMIGLLKGAAVFVADLARALDRAGGRPEIEFFDAVEDISLTIERAVGSGHHNCFGDEKNSRAPWVFASNK